MKTTKALMWAILLMYCIGMVAAASFTVNKPTGSSYIAGSYKFNVTYNRGAGKNVSNLTVGVGSTIYCRNITGTAVTIAMATGNKTTFYCNVNTKAITDDALRTFTINGYNKTGQLLATTTVAATMDNTKPTCALENLKGQSVTNERTWTITAANASSATINIMQNTHGMSENNGGTAFTWKGLVPKSASAVIKGQTSDGRNTTECVTVSSVNIESPNENVKIAAAAAAANQQPAASPSIFGTQSVAGGSSGSPNWLAIGALAVLIWLVFKKKK
jgi:hypothetical protein